MDDGFAVGVALANWVAAVNAEVMVGEAVGKGAGVSVGAAVGVFDVVVGAIFGLTVASAVGIGVLQPISRNRLHNVKKQSN